MPRQQGWEAHPRHCPDLRGPTRHCSGRAREADPVTPSTTTSSTAETLLLSSPPSSPYLPCRRRSSFTDVIPPRSPCVSLGGPSWPRLERASWSSTLSVDLGRVG